MVGCRKITDPFTNEIITEPDNKIAGPTYFFEAIGMFLYGIYRSFSRNNVNSFNGFIFIAGSNNSDN